MECARVKDDWARLKAELQRGLVVSYAAPLSAPLVAIEQCGSEFAAGYGVQLDSTSEQQH